MSGTRYARGGGVAGWNFRRKLTSRGANFLAATLLQPGVTGNCSSRATLSMLNCDCQRHSTSRLCTLPTSRWCSRLSTSGMRESYGAVTTCWQMSIGGVWIG